MEDLSSLSMGIGLFTAVISLVLPAVIISVVMRKLGLSRLRSTFSPKFMLFGMFPGLRWVFIAGISLFVGLMIATAVGAIYPKVLEPAALWLCSDGQMHIESQGYSYKPGQRGVSRNVLCKDKGGEERDITISSIATATVGYAAVLFVLLALKQLLFGRRRADAPADASPLQGGGNVFELLAQRMQEAAAARQPATPVNVQDMQGGQGTPGMQGLEGLGDMLRQQLGSGMAEAVDKALREGHVNVQTKKSVIVNGQRIDWPTEGKGAAERLQELKKLHDGGLIDEAEFQAKRAEILKDL